MTIRKAEPGDIKRIMEIYKSAQDFMISYGNDGQWGRSYPTEEIALNDIAAGNSHVVCEGGNVHGVFALCAGAEPTYTIIEGGSWLNDEPYITIHRVASDGKMHGIFSQIMDYCRSVFGNIRIDTHEKNLPMRRCIEKEGFIRCGIIYVRDGSQRIAYQWINPSK